MMNIQYGSCGGCRVFNVCVVLLVATPWPGWGNVPFFPNCGPQVSIRNLLPHFYLRQSAFHFVLSFNCLILCQLFCILRPSIACIHVLVISYCTTSYRLCVRLISVIHDWISLLNAELTFMLTEFGWGLDSSFRRSLPTFLTETLRVRLRTVGSLTCFLIKYLVWVELVRKSKWWQVENSSYHVRARCEDSNEKSRTAGGVYDGSHSAMM